MLQLSEIDHSSYVCEGFVVSIAFDIPTGLIFRPRFPFSHGTERIICIFRNSGSSWNNVSDGVVRYEWLETPVLFSFNV